MSRPLRHLIILLTAALPFPFLAHADTLVLKNGDRLTGELVKQENGTVFFRSAALGVLTLPADSVTIERSPAGNTDLELQLANTGAPEAGSHPQVTSKPAEKSGESPPPGGNAAAVAANAPGPADATGATVAVHPEPREKPEPAPSPWSRVLEFGLTNQSGRRDRSDVAVRTKLERKSDGHELRIQGHYLYGVADAERTTDNFGASARLRRGISKASFVQSETTYDHDAIKRLNHDASQSFGMGRRLFNHDDFKLNIGGGAAARYKDAVEDGVEWTYLFDAFQDVTYSINSHFKVTQAFSLLASPFKTEEYLVTLDAALITKLTNTLNMSMRYELEYDTSLLPDARKNQRIVTSIGYAF